MLEKIKPDNKQKAIIGAPVSSRQLVLAGPGSGKTEVVARRLAFLVAKDGLKPRQLLVLSFSRSAVKVLIQRLKTVISEDPVPLEDLRHISVRTFDSWSFRMLRLLNWIPADLLRKSYDENIAFLTDLMTQARWRPKLLADDKLGQIRHIIVDECQDLSGVRASLVRDLLSLIAPPKSISAKSECGFILLGDLNQAIYDWQIDGAVHTFTSADLIKRVISSYSKELIESRLETNYRSNPDLIALTRDAAHLIEQGSRAARSTVNEILKLVENTGIKCSIDNVGEYFNHPTGANKSFAILCRRNDEALFVAQEIGKICRESKMKLVLEAGDPPLIVPLWVGAVLGRFRGKELTEEKAGESRHSAN